MDFLAKQDCFLRTSSTLTLSIRSGRCARAASAVNSLGTFLTRRGALGTSGTDAGAKAQDSFECSRLPNPRLPRRLLSRARGLRNTPAAYDSTPAIASPCGLDLYTSRRKHIG
jgi:hypothetical protein